MCQRRRVSCTRCGHSFISKVKVPTCAKCRRTTTVDTVKVNKSLRNDAVLKEVAELRREFQEYKKIVNQVLKDHKEHIEMLARFKNKSTIILNKVGIPISKEV